MFSINKNNENTFLITLHMYSLTFQMDTSIYTGLGLQRLPHTVNVWVDAPSGQK